MPLFAFSKLEIMSNSAVQASLMYSTKAQVLQFGKMRKNACERSENRERLLSSHGGLIYSSRQSCLSDLTSVRLLTVSSLSLSLSLGKKADSCWSVGEGERERERKEKKKTTESGSNETTKFAVSCWKLWQR